MHTEKSSKEAGTFLKGLYSIAFYFLDSMQGDLSNLMENLKEQKGSNELTGK